MPKKKQSGPEKVYDGMLWIDIFGETKAFSVNGDDSYKSVFGALLTFFISVACIGYFIDNYISMKQYGQTIFQEDRLIYSPKEN